MRNFSLHPFSIELGQLFHDSGYEFYLVGGSVRDLFLKRDSYDLDFTTNARPDDTLKILQSWADSTWEIGKEFGTIGATKRDSKGTKIQIEVTTYRSEKYGPSSRKPQVRFGDNLYDDLIRRDFTINSMAVALPDTELVDPFSGLSDLASQIIKTPAEASDSFSDDPLRMMRAARFVSILGFKIDLQAQQAMTQMAERITMISAERVRDELIKLIVGKYPVEGMEVLVQTGLAKYILPEVDSLKTLVDEHHRHKDVYQHTLMVLQQTQDIEQKRAVEKVENYRNVEENAESSERTKTELISPDFVVRFAALMHDIGKLKTRKFNDDGSVTFRNHDIVGAKMTKERMRKLRFDKATIDDVSKLVELHMRFYGYGDNQWTDSAVRRYVTDAGNQLERLHYLTRADVTTRNQKKASKLASSYDELEKRISYLAQQEELDAIRPELNGEEIMTLLNIKPGRDVGKAYRFLLNKRMEEGPHSQQEATSALLEWWKQQQHN